MEARVAILETHVGHIRDDVKEVRADMSAIRKDVVDLRVAVAALIPRVDALPTKDFVVKLYLFGFGALIALTTAVTLFQGQIQHWLGLRP